MEKLRVLVVEPNKEPYQTKIPHTLKNLQNSVGGLIEFIELEYNVDLICNEEGKVNGLPLNRIITNDIIAGTFLVVGQHNGETISLSKKQIKKYKNIFKLNKHQNIIQFVIYCITNKKDLEMLNMFDITSLNKKMLLDKEFQKLNKIGSD